MQNNPSTPDQRPTLPAFAPWPREPGALGRLLRALKQKAADLAPPRLLVRRGSHRIPAVALTFDDGPHELTRAYLDVLDAHGAQATFFLIVRPVALGSLVGFKGDPQADGAFRGVGL